MTVAAPRISPRGDRCDAVTYQELLDADSREVPESLREQAELGPAPDLIPIAHYLGRDFFEQSIDKMWLKTWQVACRDEDIPNSGDCTLYEVVGKSLIIVRTEPETVKAFYNVCLHRGRKLVTSGGNKKEFKCPFHGFTWNPDGSFAENPFAWDFPSRTAESLALPEVKVSRWGGFIWVNFDPGAPPLESIMDPIPRHFARWDLSVRYKAIHAGKVIPCNWNIAMEAFMESIHSLTTHPQILRHSGDANAQVDVFNDHVSRIIAAKGISSPHLRSTNLSEDDIFRGMARNMARNLVDREGASAETGPIVPEGMSARSYMAQISRIALAENTGIDTSAIADAEITDTITYSVFPNIMMSGGFLDTTVLRFRPNGLDPASCLMEVMVLKPYPAGSTKPKAVPFHLLEEHEVWSDAAELGVFGSILNQDLGNMAYVQEGLMAMNGDSIEVGRYSEARIRAHHRTLSKYVE